MHALGTEVEVGRIDGALRELWDASEAATKASLVNFAIYSEAGDCLERNTDLIAEITREHACRAILIASRPAAGTRSVRAWITAHCRLGEGGRKSVCSEQVAFEILGSDANLIRNIVFAHLDSDLPLVFWWQGEFTPVFDERLYSLIDRLIIDSACWSDPAPQIERLEAARADATSRFVLYDLNWSRLLHFRLATAGLFDDAAALEALGRVDEVVVTHGPRGRLTASLLVAWIAGRAGWRIADGATLVGPGGRRIRCRLEATGSDRYHVERLAFVVPDGTLEVGHSEREACFLKATIDLAGHRAEHLHPAAPANLATLVTQQLQRGAVNPTYFTLMKAVRHLL